MKQIVISFLAILLFVNISIAEEGKVPAADVKDMKGKKFNTSEIHNDGKPFIINFWATWCSSCRTELNAINDIYLDWVDETGVKLIIISVDDSRASKRVPSFVKGKGWPFESYLDVNQDFKRAMNVNAPPHTFLYDGNGNLVYEHSGYMPGDEETLYEKVLEAIENVNNHEEGAE